MGDYQWRKDLEQYEKSSEYEREKRVRNIASSAKQRSSKDDKEGKENQRNMSIQNKSRNALININKNAGSSAKPPHSPKTNPKLKANRENRELKKKLEEMENYSEKPKIENKREPL